MTSDGPLLEVRDLRKHYSSGGGLLGGDRTRIRAVDGVSFDLGRGDAFGLVGESGCGKSTLARTVLGLEAPTAGTVRFDGEDIGSFDRAAMRRFRRRAQIVFQEPDGSLDPRMSIGESVGEPLAVQGLRDRSTRRAVVGDLLERVGLSAADADRYPREFSGGQKQRIAIARALSVNPDLLVADEPTAALDASVRAEILSLLERLRTETGLSVLLVSHDLRAVGRLCDRVAVMYLGELVETAPTEALFENPRHPYTRALLGAIPTTDPRRRGRGTALSGDLPDPADPPAGCRFHLRCPEVVAPDGCEISSEAWRGVRALRTRLDGDGIDVGETRGAAAERTGVAPDRVGDERVKGSIRREFDVHGRLADPTAERALDRALDAIVAGDADSASEILAATFESVCERSHPERRPVGPGRTAACHRRESREAEGGRSAATTDRPDGDSDSEFRPGG